MPKTGKYCQQYGIKDDNRPENLELWVGPHGNAQRAADLIPDISGILSLGG